MKISKTELIKVLSQFNPWWRGEKIPDLPPWRRAAFQELFTWVEAPPAFRSVLLSGARQVGKTTLLLQVISELLKNNIPPANILYATFDHPIIKMAGIEATIEAWREREPKAQGPEYLFLDEAQFMRDCGTWIKHQVDYTKIQNRKIVFTGSAMPLINSGLESGVGRWHTIKLTTLSFYEYLKLKQFLRAKDLEKIFDNFRNANFHANNFKNLNFNENKANNKTEIISEYLKLFADAAKNATSEKINNDFLIKNFHNFEFLAPPALPTIKSLRDLFDWPQSEFYRISELAEPYIGHFHNYLIRGGFPQTALVDSVNQAQRLLREDIIDKVLKRDMTALFGVRRVLDLEQTFLYLCMHDGGLLDMTDLCGNLAVKRPTAQNYIDLLEASHLIYRLQPFGYGKDILRAKFKIYLADAAIAPAVLLKGKSLIDDPQALGVATETAVFKHLFARYYPEAIRFTYWRGTKNHEVDVVAEINNQIIPFEVKYRAQHAGVREIKGLLELCKKKSIKYAYVVTKSIDDFGLMKIDDLPDTRIMRIPAALLCYWMGESELSQTNSLD